MGSKPVSIKQYLPLACKSFGHRQLIVMVKIWPKNLRPKVKNHNEGSRRVHRVMPEETKHSAICVDMIHLKLN
jgi:hypothetical protein